MSGQGKGTLRKLPCGGRSVMFYQPPGPVPAGGFPLAFLCTGEDFWQELPPLLPQLEKAFAGECRPFCMAGVQPVEWTRDFAPWSAPALSRKSGPFAGGAADFFVFLTQQAMPLIRAAFPVSVQPADTALAGYSLGGMAALWQAAQDPLVGKCASVSGSLWYDGFSEWLCGRRAGLQGKEIYLSLGKSEEKVRNERMRQVGVCTRCTAALLQEQAARFVLEWNDGGHFHEVTPRQLRALQWLFAEDTSSKIQK